MRKYDKLIKQALEHVYCVAKHTSLDHAIQLSQRLGNAIYLKREDQQPVFSYKIRGAYNMMVHLSQQEKKRGVVASSAGNHAQGVALAAQKLDISALIVMPKTTPAIKVDAVSRYPVEIKLHGNNYDEAFAYAQNYVVDSKRIFIPPYDHPYVIAGQATVGVEILEDCFHSAPDYIFVPVGGGGLIAGIVAFVKQHAPKTRIIPVESEEAACLAAAIQANRRVTLPSIGIFADGAAVRQIGKEPFRIIRDRIEKTVTVSNDEICAAVKDLFEETRTVAEPAGALALAGVKQYIARHRLHNKKIVAIFSGANINFDRFRHVAELAELGENREILLGVTIPETPGSFLRFCRILGPRLITEFNYRFSHSDIAHVFAGVRLDNTQKDDRKQVLKHLRTAGYTVHDLSGDQIAKMHIRYMVGGRPPQSKITERIYRIEFPERPGALLYFLGKLADNWNISLFHYRNHGAAYGRVLVGIELPLKQQPQFEAMMLSLNFPFQEETNNIAYHLFLQ